MYKNFDEYYEEFGNRSSKPTDSGLTCPITGGRLMSIGYERDVMDPDSFYQSENDPTLYFACHPFSRTVYRLIQRPAMMERAKRYFVLNEDKTWTEHIKIESGNLVPIDTPQSEIDEANEKYRKEREEFQRNYDEQVARGEIIPIKFKQVHVTRMLNELVEVKPMNPPSGILHYMNFTYGNTI